MARIADRRNCSSGTWSNHPRMLILKASIIRLAATRSRTANLSTSRLCTCSPWPCRCVLSRWSLSLRLVLWKRHGPSLHLSVLLMIERRAARDSMIKKQCSFDHLFSNWYVWTIYSAAVSGSINIWQSDKFDTNTRQLCYHDIVCNTNGFVKSRVRW